MRTRIYEDGVLRLTIEHTGKLTMAAVDESFKTPVKPVGTTLEPIMLWCAKDFEPGTFFTKGKVYTFNTDGRITFDDGRKSSQYDGFHSFLGLNPDIAPHLYLLVKRPAKIGEWVYILEDRHLGSVESKTIHKCTGDAQFDYKWRFPLWSFIDGKENYLVIAGYTGKKVRRRW